MILANAERTELSLFDTMKLKLLNTRGSVPLANECSRNNNKTDHQNAEFVSALVQSKNPFGSALFLTSYEPGDATPK